MLRAAWIACIVAVPFAAGAGEPPFRVGGDSRVHPEDFVITEFAAGLDFPFGLAELPDGSLLVGVNAPATPNSSFRESVGSLLRLVDVDGDGVADGPGVTLFESLPGPITSVRRSGSVVVVARSGGISVLRLGRTAADPLDFAGSLDLAFPRPWVHASVGTAVRTNPDDPETLDVVFNVGSRRNAEASGEVVGLGGLLAADLAPDSVYKVTLDPGDSKLEASGLVLLAVGLRNAFGLAFDPWTGDLWMADNGIDGLEDPNEPLSADELNRIPAARIGGDVEDFGFPTTYIEYRTGRRVGDSGLDPAVAFQPLPAPDGAESEGPAEIAFAPQGFPEGLNDGLFVGFHGRFFLGGLENEENPLVYVDLDAGRYFHFVGTDEPGIGHLDSLLATQDALFLVDMSRDGSLAGSGTGVIYRIRAVPEPSAASALSLILAAGVWRRHRRRRLGGAMHGFPCRARLRRQASVALRTFRPTDVPDPSR